MTGKDNQPSDANSPTGTSSSLQVNSPGQSAQPPKPTLRQRAEAAIRANEIRSAQSEALSPEAMRIVLHELRVHQIELEMQNEELRRAQLGLDTSRAHYLDLFDLAPVGYVTLSEQGVILEANLTVTALAGVARDALVKQPITRFIYKDDQDIFYLHRKQAFKTGETLTCELRMVKKDGTPFWANLAATAAQDESGAPLLRLALSDITARKRTEEEKEKLEKQNRQLQKAESLGRMAGAIAHHFNNQLQAVTMSLELTRCELAGNAGVVENLSRAMEAVRKAAEISTLMLTYLGQSKVTREPLDLSAVCLRSLPLLRAGMPQRVALATHFPSPGPVLSANANQLQQVLTNLVTNACESSGDEQGAVRLTITTVSAKEIPGANRFPIDWRPQDTAYACLEVADAGCGIAAEEIGKICDPFFSSKFAGRGLGLSVVLGIVRAHEGLLTVESKPGRGSVFRVFLPAAAAVVDSQTSTMVQAPVVAGIDPAARPTLGGTLLLVEDEAGVRETVALALVYFGFTVLAAKDGIEALELFRLHREKIGCVLSDVSMPRMNGWETLEALRELVPGLPVILLSGYSEAQVMEGHHPELPQAFLSKPFEINALVSIIDKVLANAAPIRDAIGKAVVRTRHHRKNTDVEP
jgi:PAS domain S-box-containing protein